MWNFVFDYQSNYHIDPLKTLEDYAALFRDYNIDIQTGKGIDILTTYNKLNDVSFGLEQTLDFLNTIVVEESYLYYKDPFTEKEHKINIQSLGNFQLASLYHFDTLNALGELTLEDFMKDKEKYKNELQRAIRVLCKKMELLSRVFFGIDGIKDEVERIIGEFS